MHSLMSQIASWTLSCNFKISIADFVDMIFKHFKYHKSLKVYTCCKIFEKQLLYMFYTKCPYLL